MTKPLHVAIASTTSKPGQVAANLDQIEGFARQAAQDGADLLLTPEMSASGYGPYPENLATAEPAGDGLVYRRLHQIASQTGVTVLAGFVEAAGKKRHLAHYAVYPDGHFEVQRKHRVTLAERPLDPGVELIPPDYEHNPPADPADPGQPKELAFNIFEIKGVKCAIAICFDGGIEGLWPHLASRGVELLLGPSGAGGRRDQRVDAEELKTEAGREKYAEWLEMTFFPGRRTIMNCLRFGMAHAAVNLAGFDGQRMYHIGHGTIVTATGEVPALIHGLPNLDRLRPMYTHAVIDLDDRIVASES